MHHNLVLVDKNQYDTNIFNKNLTEISEGNKHMEIIVTIMDTKGTYYFVCTKEGHANLGHKIIIQVND